MTKTAFFAFAVAVLLALFGWGVWRLWLAPEPEGAVCTQDAKLCPDGSYVGRTGPNCEFAACPSNGEEEDEPAEINFSGNVLAGDSSPLLDFVKADYDKALKTDKLVVLYFYANWCPICAEETANSLYPAFNEIMGDEVVGFRVNYRDNATDSSEEALAREFGIGYQHTKVFIRGGVRVLKSPETWSKGRYLSEIEEALAK
ncbi:MAG: thioredoxin family protein [Patescibacteria group bacterium]